MLPSAVFFLESQKDSSGRVQTLQIYGGGAGHQLGMSQWGAKGLAEAGQDFVSILRTYYADSRLITHSDQLRY